MKDRAPFICRQPGCDTRIVFARRAGTTTTLPYEHRDRAPFSIEATGCHVLINGLSFTPREAIEHFQTLGEGRTEDAARDLVAGYPWHRIHLHDTPTTPDTGEAA